MTILARLAFLTAASGIALQATPVTWYLSNVTLSDGGRAFGWFTFDADTAKYTAVNISTTPGTAITDGGSVSAGKEYTGVSGLALATNKTVEFAQAGGSVVNGGLFQLQFPSILTNTGGTMQLTGPSAGLFYSEEFYITNPFTSATSVARGVSGGSIVAASAAVGPLTWYLDGVKFDDGSAAAGSFVYDSATNTYSQVNIQTTSGGTFPTAANYNTPFSAISSASTLVVIGTSSPVAGGRVLSIEILNPLSNAPSGASALNPASSTGAEGSCVSATCQAGGKVAFTGVQRNIVGGDLSFARPTGYNKIVSQVVDGGGGSPWQSTMVFGNLTEYAAPFTVHFFSDAGSPVSIPGIGSTATGLVPPRGVVLLPSTGTSTTLTQAWARVDAAQNLTVSAQVVLKNANSAGNQQASVYGDPLFTNSVLVPFDSTGGAINGLALVNPDPSQSVTVYTIGYDNTGKIILNDASITLPPLGHTAFVFASQPGFSPLATGQGAIRVFAAPGGSNPTAPFYGINALLIKALPNLSYTNVSVVNR